MSINEFLMWVLDEDHKRTLDKIFDAIGKKCSWSIIYALMSSRSGMMNITALVHKLGSNYSAVMNCIESLEEVGIVEVFRLGRLKIVKLNENNPLVQAMKNLILTAVSISKG